MVDKNRPRSRPERRSPSKGERSSRSSHRIERQASTEVPKIPNTIQWNVLSEDNITELLEMEPPQMLERLNTLFSVTDTHINLRNSIKGDLSLLVLHFCKEQKFTPTQTGGMFTLFYHLLNLLTQGSSLSGIVNESNQLLSQKKALQPDMNVDFFNKPQTLLVNSFLESTIIGHYQLYRFCFLEDQDETIVSEDKIIGVCPPLGLFSPAPLVEAISEVDIEYYITNPPEEYLVAEEEEEEGEGEGEGQDAHREKGDEEERKEMEDARIPMVSLADVQDVLKSVGNDMINKLGKDMENKCYEKEQSHIARISKVKKAIH